MTINQKLYGADAPLPTLMELQFGPITVGYEKGFFRYFRWGEHEILRMIYFAIRDENWATYTPILSDEQWVIDPDGFRVSYTCHYEKDDATLFVWQVVAEGNVSGAFTMTIDGVAHQAFLKNRAGFCILHPILGTAGQPCEVIHPDGQRTMSQFPRTISPANPFKQVAGMRWLQAGGQWFSLDMAGDIFETEDQRNWTDASFKTFCTPQNLPFPVRLQEGEQVHQRIQFRPEQPLPVLAVSSQNDHFILSLEEELRYLPALGLGASTEIRGLSEPVIRALQTCPCDHYRIEVSPGKPDWTTEFLLDVTNAQTLGWPLLVALQLSTDHVAELRLFLDVVHDKQVVLSELLLLSTDGPVTNADMLSEAFKTIRTELPQTRIGGGTNYNFTELNRNRVSTVGLDFMSYAIHPQAHAFDNRSLVENLDGQDDTVVAAQSFCGAVPVYVSPVTLRHRLNPDARDPANRVLSNAQKTDPRQPSLWAAGWTLGSIKYLAEAGAKSITYYQTVGHQGIVSEEGQLYPIAVLVAAVLAFRGGQVIRTQTNNPLVCSTLLLVQGERRRWFVANHTDLPLSVEIAESVQKAHRISPVPAQKIPVNVEDTHRFQIEPFGLWILDC